MLSIFSRFFSYCARKVLAFHNGRGSQESLQAGTIPVPGFPSTPRKSKISTTRRPRNPSNVRSSVCRKRWTSSPRRIRHTPSPTTSNGQPWSSRHGVDCDMPR